MLRRYNICPICVAFHDTMGHILGLVGTSDRAVVPLGGLLLKVADLLLEHVVVRSS